MIAFKQSSRVVAVAVLALAAACGGGGGGGGSASPGGGVPVSAPSPASYTSGKVVLSIPNGPQSAGRAPRGISPAASSISISVTGVSTAQIFDISATSPNCSTTAGGRTCTLSVQATYGTNVQFSVTVFDGPNATGHTLSTATATTSVVAGAPFSVTLTLQGIIASLSLYDPSSGGSGGPPTFSLAAGQAGTHNLYVIAKDASGNTIIGPYASAVTVSSNNAALTVSPASVTASGQAVTFSYNGSVVPSITVSVSSGSVSNSATVIPRTNILTYALPHTNPFHILVGPDNAIYTAEFGTESYNPATFVVSATGPGYIARFDPVAKTFSEVQVGVQPIGMMFAPDGSIWEANPFDNTIGHVTGFSSYTSYPVPTASSRPRDLTMGSDGNIWYVEQFGLTTGLTAGRGARIGKFSPSSPGTMTEYQLAQGARAQNINSGPDGNLYVGDNRLSQIYKVTTAGAVSTIPMPGASPFPRQIVNGSDGNMYVSSLGNPIFAGSYQSGSLYQLTQSGTLTPIPSLLPQSVYDYMSAGAPGQVIFSDIGASAIGVLTLPNALTEYPISSGCGDLNGIIPEGVAYANDGSIWFSEASCAAVVNNQLINQPTVSHIGHMILAPGWQVYPAAQTLYLSVVGSNPSTLLGIAESGDSSPFTVTSTNTAVATVSTTANSHNFVITGAAPGTATVNIVDRNGNADSRNVMVTTASAVIQSLTRMPK